ncbi:MAG: hypothetical protein JSW67_13295 [Candidatus Latescibacterota bacterium]|nr:MAG: hypothetical protein JSW67_13295 [Candidatus Latescibacterota bacterium]
MARDRLPMASDVPAKRHSASHAAVATGAFTSLDGEEYYRISDYDRMPAFLMSLASDTDLWMFITSGGGLTAGRVDAEGSLFAYETVDKLHDAHHHTGPLTLFRVRRDRGSKIVWQPFAPRSAEAARLARNLYKNRIGNRIVFEEVHHDLELAFRCRWSASDEFGFVRTATLVNHGAEAVSVSMLDGLRNVLPYGAPLALYQHASNLVDAYKQSECDPETGLGIFALSARIVDRAEAAEELRANIVWCHGLPRCDVTLSSDALEAFRRNEPFAPATLLTGRRGSYLVTSSFELEPRGQAKWHLLADVGRSHVQVAALRARLGSQSDLDTEIETSLAEASENLTRNVASADGLQLTARPEEDAHHFTNVLFNNMRGGVFAKGYAFPTADFVDFLRRRQRQVAKRHASWLATLPSEISRSDLQTTAASTGDTDLERLAYEYLPLYFGRRHGDPSRPWNRFSIRVTNPDGSRALRYEGNWRDIFQNWEALSLSFPDFLPSIIAKFVNASTVDGFNPYRITRDGFDWEVFDPKAPWSYIGYWGDHQIIYLLKFLEALPRFAPGALEQLLVREIFSYADVPYRLKPYGEILEDSRSTIVYDTDLAERIEARVRAIGTDGKLVPDRDGSVYHVTLLEKMLVSALCKLSNLVPDAGIWMNTQRPEWNDANNALVGNGISVVTLCSLRRYLLFLKQQVDALGEATTSVSTEVVEWMRRLSSILGEQRSRHARQAVCERERKQLLDALGHAFSEYRTQVYARGFSGKQELAMPEVAALCRVALEHLDDAIRANRRRDKLYHSYNLLEVSSDRRSLAVGRLREMLEGQVAALSSGLVEPAQAVELLESLFESRLYRRDQRSFLLYPERRLLGFLERNVIPQQRVAEVQLVQELLDSREVSLLARDAFGVCRFHGDFSNARDVAAALDRLAANQRWTQSVARDRQAILELFEEVFDHASYTGRSGSMYAFEGLGCIYWHMVSKLLVAVQEITLRAAGTGEPEPVVRDLMALYYRIRAGLGSAKTAAEYGAFPTDPYSHTPAHAGAQQPGMTGQVKEEILTRFGELGIQVQDGRVRFRPVLLRRSEFRRQAGTYRFYDLTGRARSIDVPEQGLAFSFCQVPVLYQLSRDASVRVSRSDGTAFVRRGDELDAAHSRALFRRDGRIERIEVAVPEGSLI